MVVLAIGAHPDDIEYGCGGTLSKLSGDEKVHFLIFTHGEISGDIWTRFFEARDSSRIIGANTTVWNYEDGDIPVDGESVGCLRRLIQNIKPDTIFTHHPEDLHQDHRNVAAITFSASKGIDNILCYPCPSTWDRFHPNYFVDITGQFETKMKMLKCHESQADKSYLSPDAIRNNAEYWAYHCLRNGRLYEAFEIRQVIT